MPPANQTDFPSSFVQPGAGSSTSGSTGAVEGRDRQSPERLSSEI
jgi:hypothetical protein